MNKQIFILPLIAVLFWVTAAAQAQKEPFEVLKQRFESGKVLHAQFRYSFEDTFTNETSANTGILWITGEQYKIISPPQTILVDGKTSKVYDAKRNRLIISEYVEEDDDFAPSRILNGIDSTYTLVQQKAVNDEYIIELRSQDPFSLYKQITITLNRQFVPIEIIAIDRADNIITTTFFDASFTEASTAEFDITYPDDAKIIDLRN